MGRSALVTQGEEMVEGLLSPPHLAMLMVIVYLVAGSALVVALVRLAAAATNWLNRH